MVRVWGDNRILRPIESLRYIWLLAANCNGEGFLECMSSRSAAANSMKIFCSMRGWIGILFNPQQAHSHGATALQRLFHHDGERAVVKAAEKFGTMFGRLLPFRRLVDFQHRREISLAQLGRLRTDAQALAAWFHRHS